MIGAVATWAARAAIFLAPDVVGRIPAPMKTVFLTFDDGPSPTTPELLKLLDDAAAVATFFLVGSEIERFPSETRRIASAGHGIGNHSYGHLDAWKNPWSKVAEDLERGGQVIEDLTGEKPQWIRPPYGRFRPATLSWCRSRGRHLALWDVMAEDFVDGVSADRAAKRVVKNVRPGSIVVLHDGERHHPLALEITGRIVGSLVAEGWSFDRLPGSGPAPA